MDRFIKKQQRIDRRAAEVIAVYPALWTKMIDEWHQPGLEDRAWLMYSSQLLFHRKRALGNGSIRSKHRLPCA
jgi:hypothetical protein